MGDEKLLQEIGQRINARRRELHYTQEYLAEKMDVSIQMISNLELGKKAIRPENLVKVCAVLDISADYILTGRQPEWITSDLGCKIAQLSEKDQKILGMIVDSLSEKKQ